MEKMFEKIEEMFDSSPFVKDIEACMERHGISSKTSIKEFKKKIISLLGSGAKITVSRKKETLTVKTSFFTVVFGLYSNFSGIYDPENFYKIEKIALFTKAKEEMNAIMEKEYKLTTIW